MSEIGVLMPPHISLPPRSSFIEIPYSREGEKTGSMAEGGPSNGDSPNRMPELRSTETATEEPNARKPKSAGRPDPVAANEDPSGPCSGLSPASLQSESAPASEACSLMGEAPPPACTSFLASGVLGHSLGCWTLAATRARHPGSLLGREGSSQLTIAATRLRTKLQPKPLGIEFGGQRLLFEFLLSSTFLHLAYRVFPHSNAVARKQM